MLGFWDFKGTNVYFSRLAHCVTRSLLFMVLVGIIDGAESYRTDHAREANDRSPCDRHLGIQCGWEVFVCQRGRSDPARAGRSHGYPFPIRCKENPCLSPNKALSLK